MDKTFNVAGYSTLNGVRKMRFAKDLKRANVLVRNGHTDIELKVLPYPMTKEQAAEFLAQGWVSAAKQALTFEAALALVPVRDKGRFVARAVREAQARELMAA